MRSGARLVGSVQNYGLAVAAAFSVACGEDPGSGSPTGTSSTATTTLTNSSNGGPTTSGTTSSGVTSSSMTSTTGTGTTTGTGGSGGASSTGGMGGTSAGGTSSGGTGGMTVDCNMGALRTRLPCLLSETGLYQSDMVTLGEGVHPYSPQFKLWTDSAEKRRWVWLPPDTQIDTADMNYWSFPIGTKFWKEFSRDGVRVETRLIEKQQSGTWYTVAYLWNEDQLDAVAVPDGMLNASNTEHDVPNADQCWTCHSQQPDKALGFSAIQLSHAAEDANDSGEWTLETLIADDLLTAPPPATFEFAPEDWPEQTLAALGYMHGNCGTCHNPMGSANSATGLDLWLKVEDVAGTAEESSVYQGIVDVDIMKVDTPVTASKRIAPGSLEDSAIYQRLMAKGETWSMPPLGTEVTDPTGQQLLEQFIMGLAQQ